MSKESFSPREMEVLALAWQCMETEPKIDFDTLASLAGYGSRNSASVTFGNIKRKLKAHSEGGGTGNGTPTTTPKKPATTKTPKSSGKRAAGGPGNDESPSKKKKPAKKPAKKSTRDLSDDEEFRQVRVKSEEAGELLRGANEYFNQGTAYQHGGGYGGYTYQEEPENNI